MRMIYKKVYFKSNSCRERRINAARPPIMYILFGVGDTFYCLLHLHKVNIPLFYLFSLGTGYRKATFRAAPASGLYVSATVVPRLPFPSLPSLVLAQRSQLATHWAHWCTGHLFYILDKLIIITLPLCVLVCAFSECILWGYSLIP